MNKVRVGVIGTGFIGNIHVDGFRHVPDGEVVAVASPTPGKAAKFAAERGISDAYEDYRKILARDDVDGVTVGVPNHLHREVVVAAAEAAVGLAIIIAIYRRRETIDVTEVNLMKW